MRRVHILFIVIVMVSLAGPFSQAVEKPPSKPNQRDKCPVCGMFVYKFPDYLARISFKDGTVAFFDGAKDMYKYYFNLSRYNPEKKISDIESIRVMDYYSLSDVDGMKAFYVLGSDAFGPMGRELIPFEKESEAKEFMKDHKGKSILRFQDITHAIVKGLD